MPPKGSRKISAKEEVDEVIDVIDVNAEEFLDGINTFSNLASSPGITDYARIMLTVKLVINILKDLGAEVQECYSDRKFEGGNLPVVLALLGADETKPTALVYCQLDGTGQRPEFPSSAKYVRGRAVIDTASFLIWINMIKAHKEALIALPYNLKFCVDSSSRSEATQLIEILSKKTDTFLSDVSLCFACLSHGINRKLPNIIYGVRGMCDFYIKIKKEGQDLQFESCDSCGAFLDMLYMMNSLVDSSGNILINGMGDDVPDITDEEKKWFASISLDIEAINDYFLVNGVVTDEKVSFIEKSWRLPAISFKGIEINEKDPNEFVGRFTILTVPNQTPKAVRKIVLNYLNKKWKERKSENSVEFGMDYWCWPWRADQFDEKYKALAEAILVIYGQKPQSILSGSHFPFPAILRKLTQNNVLLFSLGSFYDFHLTQHERISVKNYINGIKVISRMMHYTEKIVEQKKGRK